MTKLNIKKRFNPFFAFQQTGISKKYQIFVQVIWSICYCHSKKLRLSIRILRLGSKNQEKLFTGNCKINIRFNQPQTSIAYYT